MRLVKQLTAVAVVAVIGGRALSAVDGKPWLTLAVGLLTAVASVFVYQWVVRRTEQRPVTELARSGAWSALGRGAFVGAATFAVTIASVALHGNFHLDGWGSVTGALGLIGFMATVSVTEELIFRGVLFRIAEERFGTWAALLSTSALFGLMHLINENATVWGAIAIGIEAGGMLTAAYIATRSLWLPIGLHFGWNFAASGIFSTEVSGNGATQGLLESSTSGSMLVTGGSFGPEASIYSVLFCVLVTAGLLWLARQRGQLNPRRRRAGGPVTLVTLAR